MAFIDSRRLVGTLAIIAAIAVFVGFAVRMYVISAQQGIAKDQAKTRYSILWVHRFCLEHHDEFGRYPIQGNWISDMLGETSATVEHNKYFGNFFDMWGNKFNYRYPASISKSAFDIYSNGPNGIDENGGGDDIGNWVTGKPRRGFMFENIDEVYAERN